MLPDLVQQRIAIDMLIIKAYWPQLSASALVVFGGIAWHRAQVKR